MMDRRLHRLMSHHCIAKQIAIELDITYSLCSFFIIDIDFLVTFNHSYYLNKLSILLLNKV
jgi:hypothetical protein